MGDKHCGTLVVLVLFVAIIFCNNLVFSHIVGLKANIGEKEESAFSLEMAAAYYGDLPHDRQRRMLRNAALKNVSNVSKLALSSSEQAARRTLSSTVTAGTQIASRSTPGKDSTSVTSGLHLISPQSSLSLRGSPLAPNNKMSSRDLPNMPRFQNPPSMPKQPLVEQGKRSLKERLIAKRKPVIVVVAGPGGGKGTQCKLLEAKGFYHISTGDLIRKLVEKYGKSAGAIAAEMAKGNLLGDDMVLGLLEAEIEKKLDDPNCLGFLIDGFPRNLKQANMLDDKVGKPAEVIYLNVPDAELKERLKNRGETSENARADDKEEATIDNRIKTFHQSTEPVLQHYGANVQEIKGDRLTVADTSDKINAKVDKLMKSYAAS